MITRDSGTKVLLTQINKLEEELNVVLPKDYKEFLISNNGGRAVKNFYPLKEPINKDYKNGTIADIHWFYSIDTKDIYDMKRSYYIFKVHEKRMPLELIPIGVGSCGDQICLCIKGDNYGKVYFWDHENEQEEPTYDNVYLIANSFTDFINSLYEYKPEEEEKK